MTSTSKPAPLAYSTPGHLIQSHVFPYRRSPDQDGASPAHHPIVVVGAGPIGLSLAIDLAQRGQPVLLLDNDDKLSVGSRAICFSKRTLEIWDRLGVCQPMLDRGVEWHVGRVFFKTQELYRFDLQPEAGHECPAFINLQQYYAEAFLAVRAAEMPNVEIRWQHAMTALEQTEAGVVVGIQTPEGQYRITSDYVIACDGARSSVRSMIGQESKGRIFQDRFLIADLKFDETVEFPAERWFWFDPPFHPNQSVLMHRQPDSVWRIDFQLGWDADPDLERQPERIQARVDAMMRQALGHELPYELQWASVYTFACLRMEAFRHGRVLFAGDAAHRVSPFGARGANSGVQDTDNLAWKLAAVIDRKAPDALLDTYGREREYAADENILNSTRSTDFITPKSDISRVFRDATLELAGEHAFARRLVNSGRLSVPATLRHSPLNTADVDDIGGAMVPGAPAIDAPLLADGRADWLLHQLDGEFTLLLFGEAPAWADLLALKTIVIDIEAADLRDVAGDDGSNRRNGDSHGRDDGSHRRNDESHRRDRLPRWRDAEGLAAQRYDARAGTAYLIRPDQHVCARWRAPTHEQVMSAWQRALGHDL